MPKPMISTTPTRVGAKFEEPRSEFKEIVVQIKRCTKVVKGGKRFKMAALVVVGDGQGQVGIGYEKAKEVPFAVRKAVKNAQKHLFKVSLKDTTIPHRISAKHGSTTVLLRPACRGTGLIAGAAVRAVVELAGIKDILTKIIGNTNPINVTQATAKALQQLKSKQEIEKLRGIQII